MLKPKSWSNDKAAKFFNTNKQAVQKAVTLKKEEGILSVPTRSKQKGTGTEDLDHVIIFL